jgi:RNA polymerase sigma factor (sigma-70 family)
MSAGGGDYAVTVKVRNGRILSRMRELGIRNASDLAARSKVGPTEVGLILNMKKPPTVRGGDYAEAVYRIAAVLRCSPDELFTDRQKFGALAHNETTVFMAEEQVEALMYDSAEDSTWAKIEAQRLLGILPPRTKFIVEQRLDGASFDEIGEELNVTPQRVRQIEAKAIRKMKFEALIRQRDA